MKKTLIYALCAIMAIFMIAPLHADASSLTAPDKKKQVEAPRTIVSVEQVNVTSEVGTVPVLPYQLWVTYSDGTQAYRQVRWTNAALVTEQEQANPELYPVGKEYQIKGFITGDNTTANGYPVVADVKVVAEKAPVPSNVTVAEPLPLDQVTIIGENRLTSNRDLAIEQILSWDVTQQLYNYRDTYGRSTEGYTVSDGWDSPTTKLKGHGSGHYMSALSFAFASTDDPEKKAQLRERMRTMVDELRACQELTFVWNEELGRYWEARDFAPEAELIEMEGTWEAFDQHKKEFKNYGYGYINAIPAHHVVLVEKYSPYNNDSGVWAPYYTIHKQLAGLIDIANNVDDKEIADKAFLIAKDMGLWIWNRLSHRTYVKTDGTREERRATPGNRYEMWNMYIAGEDGGVGESLARLSEMATDPTEKAHLLEASNFFDSPAFYDPLSVNIDDIRTRHANQHIPKITSALRSYRGNADPYYYNIAENFWTMVQGRYSYATGGVGNVEMFRQPYTQILSMNTNGHVDRRSDTFIPNPTLNETCCVYNLLKLSKDLACFNPDDAKYMDYYERALYNQLIGSLHPHHYMVIYHYAVGLNAQKAWGSTTPQSTCCGGTGSENHVKYQEAAYFVNDNTIWVGLYLPTVANWEAKGVKLEQDCLWPAQNSKITIKEGAANFTMKLRVPYWATENFDIKLNGKSIAASYQPGTYAVIDARDWKAGDVVEVTMPFTKHINYGPDKMETASTVANQNEKFTPMWVGTLFYGPLAMATTGVSNWDQATVNIDSYLNDIKAGVAEGDDTTDGPLYTLTLGDKVFYPDYYVDQSTHYFRINLVNDPSAALKLPLISKVKEAKIYPLEHYTVKSYFDLAFAVEAAEELCKQSNVSQKQLDKQIAAIDKGIAGLVAKGLDKSGLDAAIKNAEAKKNVYTWDSYEDMRKVLGESISVYEKCEDQKLIDVQTMLLGEATGRLIPAVIVEKEVLWEALQIVEERKKAQEAWNAMEIKVPVHAPWAPYGYARMMKYHEEGMKVLGNVGKNYNQSEVNALAAEINASINTMRPGNLPEPEDMNELVVLLKEAKEKNLDKELIDYAEMVVSYVTDGSGTMDMIVNATAQLKEALKK